MNDDRLKQCSHCFEYRSEEPEISDEERARRAKEREEERRKRKEEKAEERRKQKEEDERFFILVCVCVTVLILGSLAPNRYKKK